MAINKGRMNGGIFESNNQKFLIEDLEPHGGGTERPNIGQQTHSALMAQVMHKRT